MNPSAVIIEAISPLIDGGRHPIKRAVGEDLAVEADIFKDGHDEMCAVLKWRKVGAANWHETAMRPVVNDRWSGVLHLYENTDYEYTIEAWGDAFLSWAHDFQKRVTGGQKDVTSELLEGVHLVEAAAGRLRAAGVNAPTGTDAERDADQLEVLGKRLGAASAAEAAEMCDWSELLTLMLAVPDRSQSVEQTPYLRVSVQRERAVFASWYEFFPRSAEGKADVGSTFRDCLGRVDDARRMGFDVIYFPPIHPIGTTKRKGRNNSVTCEPGEPGVPYAIGNRHQKCPNGGGHRDVAPELGTMRDFEWLVKEIHQRGMEVALDFAINCSPDHPYVHEHPDWFFKRPDGTIKYAENPPKKYEDVYPLNYYNPDWEALWAELTDVILFWCSKKVRIFRVDNPHTKPVAFWEYLIHRVRKEYPDAIFLSEAFTRPKMMKVLAKVGYQQSYTYFTWRNSKQEIIEYFTELTQTEMAEYFLGNLFVNTPDILPWFLQEGGRPAFLIRAVLATTLSPVWGMYSGYELCENAAVPGKEEYYDSEKYQFKGRDWDAPGNIKEYIARLNAIRHGNRALHGYRNLRFHPADNDHVLCYSKTTPALDNILVVIVSVDPYHKRTSYVELPLEDFGIGTDETYQVHDLLTDERYLWKGARNYVELDPATKPAHVFRVRRWLSREQSFDYFA